MKLKISGIAEIMYLFVSFFVLLISIFRVIENYQISMYILIFLFFYLFFLTIGRRNFSIYQVYLISFFVFLLARVFLNCVGLFDLRYMNHFQRVYMSDAVAQEAINLLTVFLIGTSYAWIFFGYERTNQFFECRSNLSINNIIKSLYYLYVGLFIVKLFYVFRYTRQFGYLAIFNGTISSMHFPIIFSGVATITETLFIILLFFNRDEKSFKHYSVILLVAGFVKMCTGQRGYALVLLMFLLYMYSSYYKEIKITNWKIIISGLVIPILIQFIYNVRYGLESGLREIIRNNVYIKVLEAIGGSLEAIGNTVIYDSEFTNKVPFLLGYFVDLFSTEPAGQVLEDITTGNYLGDHLTYAVNRNAFYAGHGIGTSLVAEAYSSFNKNLVLVFIFAFLVCLVAHLIANYAYKNIYLFGFSYYFLTDFIYSPRDSVFKSIKNIVFMMMVCFIVKRINRTSQYSSRKRK